jgi:DNA-binding Lrp family transcriptional regulator
VRGATLNTVTRALDEVDLRLLATLRATPQATVSEIAAAVGIARGTVYSRADRLRRDGVITGYGPDVDPPRAGLGVLAFATLEIRQGSHDATIEALAAMPEVTEIHTITGEGDLLCRIVARSNDHLHEVLQRIAAIRTVDRSQTQLALSTPHRTADVDAVIALGTPDV